jgi:nucleotide-binding universal stress UspA family protein
MSQAIPREVISMYKSILVPLDGSGRAEKILPHVVSLAQCYSASVTFLQVIELTPVLIVDYGLPGGILPELVEQTKTEAEAYLNSWKDKFTEKDIKSGMRVEQGPIVETVIRVAEEENADLIAMASHGRTGLSHVFYGSVASGVLSRVDRPLLLVRSRD